MNLWRRNGDEGPAEITVRPASEADAEAVARMARALSLSDGGRPSRFSAESFISDGFGDKPRFHAIVAEIQGKVVGYAVFYHGYDTDTASPGTYLADLYVDEASRRRGAGHRLVSAVAAAGRQEGGRWMFWSVLRQNKGARRFYKAVAPELRDVIVCAAFGSNFDQLADATANTDDPAPPVTRRD